MSGWNIGHATSYTCPFLISAVTDVQNWYTQLATARDLPSYCKEYGQETALGQSVFTDDMWIALYRIADYALSNYLRGRGLSFRDGLTGSTRVDLLLLAGMSVQVLRKKDS